MIDVYYAATPNGQKLRLYMEETGLAHRLVPVRLSAGEQFAPDFLAISPNNKIPAIVDHDPQGRPGPVSVFESGAILLYLAQKTGQLWPTNEGERLDALQWLFWQVAGLGPMAGQAGYFRVYAPSPVPEGIERYTRELARLYGVLDRHLEGRAYIAGATYSIADVATYPWIVPHEAHGQDLASHPNLQRWFADISARPAVQRAYEGVENTYAKKLDLTEEQRKTLFQQDAAKAK